MSSPTQPAGTFEAALEDFLTRVDNGEQPDRTEYYQRYPKYNEQLACFFEDLDFVDGQVAREKRLGRDSIAQGGVGARTGGSTLSAYLPEVHGFTVFEEIGQGSQGLVYKAEQHGTRRMVALKLIREGVLASKGERRRFESEVALASRLQHPNIAAVYECGEDNGRAFYAMQYIDGESLDAYLSTRTLDIRQTLDLFLQVCDAMVCAHQRGVIHRDLKPSNIIVSSTGTAHVVDFGLAKSVSASDQADDANVTQVGEFAGTLYYASPEQVRRLPTLVDVRTDVYALGVILYELLTDCYPYQISDESKEGLSRHILATEPTKPSAIRRDIDNDLETIVLHALEKDIERRYQSVDAFAEDIRRYVRGEAIEAKRDSSWYVLRKTLRRYRWPVAIASGILIALVTFAVTIFVLYRQAESARATTRARMEIVRESQQFVLGKLDELSWMANRSADAVALNRKWLAKSGHPLMGRAEAEQLLSGVSDLPEAISKSDWPDDVYRCDEAAGWLREHENELDEIETLSLRDLFPFPVNAEFKSEFIWSAVSDLPGRLGFAAKAIAFRAVCESKEGRYDVGIRGLSAARAIGVALGDGRRCLEKGVSFAARLWTYDAALNMLRGKSDKSLKRPVAAWAVNDPPVAPYRHCLISTRQTISQFLEEATFAETADTSKHIDLDTLSRVSGDVMEQIGDLTDRNRALARLIPAEEVLSLLDLYFNELAECEVLSESDCTERTAALHRRLYEHRAWLLLRPMLPSLRLAITYRKRVVAIRTQMLVTAHLYRFYWRTGRWPEAIGDALPIGSKDSVVNPVTGHPIRFHIEDNIPIVHFDPEINPPVYSSPVNDS